MKLQEVRESALALPRRSREKLAQELAESILTEERPEYGSRSESVTAEWKEEIKRRMDEYARGEAKTVPGEKVMAYLRKRIEVRTVFHQDAWEELVEAYETYHSESESGGRSFAGLTHQALVKLLPGLRCFPCIRSEVLDGALSENSDTRSSIRSFLIILSSPSCTPAVAPATGAPASRKSNATGIKSFCIAARLT